MPESSWEMVKSPHVTVPYPNLWVSKVLRNMGQIQNTHMSSAKSDFILLGISLLPSSTIGHLPWTSRAIGHHDDVLLSLCDHIASNQRTENRNSGWESTYCDSQTGKVQPGLADQKTALPSLSLGKYDWYRDKIQVYLFWCWYTRCLVCVTSLSPRWF